MRRMDRFQTVANLQKCRVYPLFEHEKSLHWEEYSTMNTKVFYIFKVMKLEIVDVVVLFPVDAFKRKGLNRMKKLMTIHIAFTVL